jgi:hypothetical protein
MNEAIPFICLQLDLHSRSVPGKGSAQFDRQERESRQDSVNSVRSASGERLQATVDLLVIKGEIPDANEVFFSEFLRNESV